MGRRRKFRNIEGNPLCTIFKPAGIPQRSIEITIIGLDEYEAFRLADKEGYSMQQGAEKMGISAPTFNRLLQSAHNKIADALVEGKAIKICAE